MSPELIGGLIALFLVTGMIVMLFVKTARDQKTASSGDEAATQAAHQKLTPGLGFKYRTRVTTSLKAALSGEVFVLENDRGIALGQIERRTFGRGLTINDTELTVSRYRPGEQIPGDNTKNEDFRVQLFSADKLLWADIRIISNHQHKGYAFSHAGGHYELKWGLSNGLWGALGDVKWPAKIVRQNKPLAEMIRRDSGSFWSDFSNTQYVASHEELPPDLLGLLCYISCTDFFPRRR
jgi:hypothetical protein